MVPTAEHTPSETEAENDWSHYSTDAPGLGTLIVGTQSRCAVLIDSPFWHPIRGPLGA